MNQKIQNTYAVFYNKILIEMEHLHKMQNLLSCLKSANLDDSISILAYISQIRSNFLLQHEQEILSLELYNCLKNIESINTVEAILTYFENAERENFVTIKNFTIRISDKWFFKLILLYSLRHSKELFNKKDTAITIHQKYKILQKAILTYRADQMQSILMLRLIESIIKKHKEIIDSTLALELLFFSQKVAIAPFESFRSYSQNISKIAILVLELNDIKVLLDLTLLPIRGVETLELVPYFKSIIDKNICRDVVTKIIQMFSNNIENREGGFLYRSILFEDFSYWKEVVWPQFFLKFQMVDFEGEFCQSLVKYWIPQCVSAYKVEFYTFISAEPISNYIKGHILLETRRKGLIKEYSRGMVHLLSKLFEDGSTTTLGLKIVSSYFKRNLYPCNVELKLVKRYLYGQTGTLDNEELKCLHKFLSQIGVTGSDLYHLDIRSTHQEKRLACYENYVINLFRFCLRSLGTSNRDIAAQILVIFWKLTNDEYPYLLNYKLEAVVVGFYSKIFEHKFNTDLKQEVLLESNRNFPELTKLGRLILLPSKLYADDYLLKFIDKCSEMNSIVAAESIKNVSSIIVSQNEANENLSLLQNLFDAVSKHFQTFVRSLRSVFKGVLLLDAVLEVSKSVNSRDACEFVGFDQYCLPVIEDILQEIVHRIYQNEITEKGNTSSTDEQYDSICKIQKIVESLLNNLLQYIMQESSIWCLVDKPKIMDLLVRIIESSNMRRPTTISAQVLKHIAKLIDEEYQKDDTITDITILKRYNEDASYRIILLHETLRKLSDVAPVQNLTIRRNPESRLIIHALCQSDMHPQKPLLGTTLLHLLKILSNPTSTDSTVSSAIHCTEILISDHTLYNHTLRFVPDVILHFVEHFKNRNWVVRNASIQLARSLIDRFLGVLIGPNNRPKSAEDLLCLFPQLIIVFYQTLIQEPLTDSSIIVMQIFSESQTKRQPIKSVCMETTKDILLSLFVRIIKENRGHYGLFAVRAYTSLCSEDEIPNVVEDVIDFIIGNFIYIKDKHTLRNFMLLLSELNEKFSRYIYDFSVKPHGYYRIHENFDRLSMFLKRLNLEQFNLLLVKVLPIDEAMITFKTSNFDLSDYAHRIWEHNYIPLLVVNTDADCLHEVLKDILFKNILECIQVKILSILVDRYMKNNFSGDVIENILKVLVHKAVLTDDSRNYLLLCYFKVIFLFFKGRETLHVEEPFMNNMRLCYTGVKNVQKMFVLILVLTRVGSKSGCDKSFIGTAVQCCQNLNLTNFEVAKVLSEMLPYLYMNVFCRCDKYRVLKMAVLLIVEHGLYDFVRFVTASVISSPLIAMIQILDFTFLSEFFDSHDVACKFIKEFYDYVLIEYARNSKNIHKTYYVEEKVIFVDRIFIDRIILKFLRDFNRKQGNLEWFNQRYECLQRRNK